MELKEGTKYDAGKLRFDLLSSLALNELVGVLTHGAAKYEDHNWRKGIPLSRLLAASHRHLNAIMGGEDIDTESGYPHAAHLMCNAMFIIEQGILRQEFDDRWKPPLSPRLQKIVNHLMNYIGDEEDLNKIEG